MVLENGVSRYGVEAKRPQVAHNIIPRLQSVREQLAEYDLRGAILVDVSDCFRDLPHAQLDAKIRETALSIYDEIFVSGEGYRPGNSGIMVAGAYSRVAWTSVDRDLDSEIGIHSSSTIGLFAIQRNTLLDHRARWLRAAFEEGLWQLNQTLAERRAEGVECSLQRYLR